MSILFQMSKSLAMCIHIFLTISFCWELVSYLCNRRDRNTVQMKILGLTEIF